MLRFTLILTFVSFVLYRANAQTSESIQYRIVQPANVDLTLTGTLTIPAGSLKNLAVVLIVGGTGPVDRDGNSAYGLTGNTYKLLADSLVLQGLAVARYDKRLSGTNRSEALTRLPQPPLPDDYISDAVGFIRLLQADRRFKQVVVIGHDEGSLVGMRAARLAGASKFVSVAGAGRNLADLLKEQLMPANGPADVRRELLGLLDSLHAGQAVHPQSVQLKAQFAPRFQAAYRAWMQFNPVDELKAFSGPVLIVQAGNDTQLAPVDAQQLQAARPDASFQRFNRMTHQLKNYEGTSLIGNRQTYNQPNLPVTPGFPTIIAQFVGI